MKKKPLFIAGAVILIIIIFFLVRSAGNKTKYRTVEIDKGDITSTVEATGEVKPEVIVDVGCQVTGKVEKIYVDFNSQVKKGQLIAVIDPTKYEAKVQDSQASYNQAKEDVSVKLKNIKNAEIDVNRQESMVKKNKALTEDKKKTFERYTELVKSNFIPQADVDTAEANYIAAQQDLKSAQDQLAQQKLQYQISKLQHSESLNSLKKAEAGLNDARADLSYTKIISPIDGIVIARKIDEGQTVVSNFQTATLFRIANNLSRMEVYASINESDVGSVKEGQESKIQVDAYPGKIFSGKIVQVRDEAQEIDKTIYYDAVIKIDNPELLLKPGMTADVEISTAFKPDVLRIPNEALRFIPQAQALQAKLKDLRSKESKLPPTNPDQTKGVVWVMNKKGPHPVEIILGMSDNKYAEFIAGPLKEKEKLTVGEITK
ncbi:MAG: efflux RND transporter periplasmic adaptor subunit [Armatimonadota bacterium]